MARTQRVIFSFDERSLESLQKIKEQALCVDGWAGILSVRLYKLCSRASKRDSAVIAAAKAMGIRGGKARAKKLGRARRPDGPVRLTSEPGRIERSDDRAGGDPAAAERDIETGG